VLAALGAGAAAALVLLRSVADGLTTVRSSAPELDVALAGLAAALGLVLLAWTALAGLVTVAASALPAGSGAALALGDLAERITPVAMRRLLAVVLGAALVSGAVPAEAAVPHGTVATAPVAAGPDRAARAGVSGLDPAWAAAAHAPDLDPGWSVPAPQRPVALDPTWGQPGRLRPAVHAERTVAVRRGDTLWDLAARELGPAATDAEIAEAWPYWFTANRAVIGPDPDVLRPGQRLVPPSSTPPSRTGGAA
jgi:hypothetical protein